MFACRVKLEGKDTSSLRITGNVVEGFLDLLSYGTQQPIRCVEFGCTQYGTDCTESALLYNNSPESVCFVAVLDEDVAGQELVSLKGKLFSRSFCRQSSPGELFVDNSFNLR